jgi:uncharacterized protein YeaO (DUF488 family)
VHRCPPGATEAPEAVVRIKRAYETAAPSDGHRILVDRLWPRGLRKEGAHIDAWLKELAPSDELRRWFGHEPDRFAEFQKRYERELANEPARTLFAELTQQAARETITLIYAAKDAEHNNAVVLAQAIERRLGAASRRRATAAPRAATRGRPSAAPRAGARGRPGEAPRAGARAPKAKVGGGGRASTAKKTASRRTA